MKNAFTIIILLVSCSLLGQNYNSKRFVKTDSFKCEFYVSNKQIRKFFVNDSVIYHWCKAQKLYATQGGYSGQLVDGHFTKFYSTGQLAEQGEFRMGLRNGKWRFWHANGVLKLSCNYRDGKIQGKLKVYNKHGQLVREEKYRRGKLKNRSQRKENKPIGDENKPSPKIEEKVKLKEKIKLFIESKKTTSASGVVEQKDGVETILYEY